MLKFLIQNVTKDDIELYCYTKPLEALKEIPKINPDLIITDYMMFDIDGIDLIKILKEQKIEVKEKFFTVKDNTINQEFTYPTMDQAQAEQERRVIVLGHDAEVL